MSTTVADELEHEKAEHEKTKAALRQLQMNQNNAQTEIERLEGVKDKMRSATEKNLSPPQGWEPSAGKTCKFTQVYHHAAHDPVIASMTEMPLPSLLLECLSGSSIEKLSSMDWLDSTIASTSARVDTVMDELSKTILQCAIMVVRQNLHFRDASWTFLWSSCLMTELCCRFNIPSELFKEEVKVHEGDALLVVAGKLRLKMLLSQRDDLVDDDEVQSTMAASREEKAGESDAAAAGGNFDVEMREAPKPTNYDDAVASLRMQYLDFDDDRFKPDLVTSVDYLGLPMPEFLCATIKQDIVGSSAEEEWFITNGRDDFVLVHTDSVSHGWHRQSGVWTFFDSKPSVTSWSKGTGQVGWVTRDGVSHVIDFSTEDNLNAYVETFLYGELLRIAEAEHDRFLREHKPRSDALYEEMLRLAGMRA